MVALEMPAVQISFVPSEVEDALECLLRDPAFLASARNKQFLRFVVTETLAGRAHRIKSYAIAVDVFGRPTDFDGTADPIVRIEASRLRAALSSYYAVPSCDARLQIFLPRGSYVPGFRRAPQAGALPPEQSTAPGVHGEERPAPTPSTHQPASTEDIAMGTHERLAPASRAEDIEAAQKAPVQPTLTSQPTLIGRLAKKLSALPFRHRAIVRPPILFVDQIEALTADAPTQLLARTLGQSLLSALGQYEGIVISRKPIGGDEAILKLLSSTPGRLVYRLAAEVRIDENVVRLWWCLSDVRTMEICRSASEEGPWRSPTSAPVETDIADKVAAAIARRNGLINSLVAKTFPDPPPPGFPSVLRAQRYTMTLDPASFPIVRRSLERTVADNPDYAEAWAYLAYLYADETRHRYCTLRSPGESKALAGHAAANALRLAPFSALAHFARMVVSFQAGDDADFADAAGRVLALSPSDPKMLTVVGNRFYAIGRQEYGLGLIRRGLEIAGTPAPMEAFILALDHYLNEDYRASLLLLRSMPNDVYTVLFLTAACHGRLGDAASAQPALDRLSKVRPAYASEVYDDFRRRRFQRSVADKVVEGLRKAGMEILEDADAVDPSPPDRQRLKS